MPDDPDESFVIQTVLENRPSGAVPSIANNGNGLALYAPGDDAASIPGEAVVTVDAMVEEVHWDDRMSAADVGWKLVASNASDINAMGAKPDWAVLTMCLPRPLDRSWVVQFAQGLGQALSKWSIQLIGGDTTRSPSSRMLSLTMGGSTSHPVDRCGATAGDDIWVTGSLGGAAAGFFGETEDKSAFLRPSPPIGLGAALAEANVATAMMDLSDGLSQDLPRLCLASGVGAVVDESALPAHSSLLSHSQPLPYLVGFGEEYELLFTASPDMRRSIEAIGESHGAKMSRIGCIHGDPSSGVHLTHHEWPTPLFSHFTERYS